MTEAQRAYMHARQRIDAVLLNPVTNLLDAAKALVADAEARAVSAEVALKEMRPVWAQGYTSDSQAAQGWSCAVAEMWAFLGAQNQTQAMERLRDLVAVGKTAPASIWADRAAGQWHPGDEA
jgi:hypothetical protein